MKTTVKVLRGNPTEEELVALVLAIENSQTSPQNETPIRPSSWQCTNKLGKPTSSWLFPSQSVWLYSQRMSQAWQD